MKCPFCNVWTEVYETRNGRRRRRCANEHRFTTLEVVVVSESHRSKAVADAVVIKHMTIKAAAAMYGIRSDSYASRCVRKHYPQFNTRSDGQRRRRERERAQAS